MHDPSYSDDEITPWFSMMTMLIRQGLYQLRLHNSHEIVDGWYPMVGGRSASTASFRHSS